MEIRQFEKGRKNAQNANGAGFGCYLKEIFLLCSSILMWGLENEEAGRVVLIRSRWLTVPSAVAKTGQARPGLDRVVEAGSGEVECLSCANVGPEKGESVVL